MIAWLEKESPFPPVEAALRNPDGLLAAGADLSPERLLAAYRRGIFPWYSDGDPILWWSPDPRMVLIPEEFKISRSLAKTLRNKAYQIRFDTGFDQVMCSCAQVRPDRLGTWISAEMREAYNRLHRLGHAHSVETWIDERLAGGLYGVAIGRVFFGESMFADIRDASKIALAALVRQCLHRGIRLIDCQMHTGHLASLGARDIARSEFSRLLAELINYRCSTGSWAGAAHGIMAAKT
ncbi:MAG: leucyl/phenylalanyl-tRNA--protein transferase [Betaproteobacteria bacterium RIFCSPLOWO2_12_FULL_63_13]|nr:MAG: leucyl/phenylalanyl-tRNA--protein transferase [Betaproteobacteria bacterium RIFCSPLOWO2_12_FULL_63_13]